MADAQLIPYTDSRAVVLRRGNAVVVYDTNSRHLLVRDASEQPIDLDGDSCPFCRRPLSSSRRGPPRENADHAQAFGPEGPFRDPEYFAMLAASQRPSPAGSGNSTPNRVVHAALRSGRSRDVSGTSEPPSDAHFVTSEPAPSTGQGISSSAFSPGYFHQFFREERELGRGGNGVVLLVEHIIDGVSLGHFACKRIPVGDSRSHFEKVVVEIRILQRIPHKNLVAYHWTWLEDFQPSKFSPKVPALWILQEYCNGGDLQSYVLGPQKSPLTAETLKEKLRRKSRGDIDTPSGPGKLSFDEIFSFFRDITSGLHHLHSKGYIHRDLKPSNCLLQIDGGRTRVLISDFGEVQAAGAARVSSGATGTISYCAPEVLEQSPDGTYRNFSTKSDIFSLGMVVYFMCFGRLPYANADGVNEDNEDLDLLRTEISNWRFNDEARVRPDLPETIYKSLKKLLSRNPHERPSTDEILTSIKDGVALGEEDWAFGDYSPRVSSADSPAPRPAANRSRRQSYMASRPGVNVKTRSRSPIKHDRSRPLSPPDSSMTIRPRKIDLPPNAHDPHPPQQSPRLMLPPPPERPIVHEMARLFHQPHLAKPLRAALFLVKLVSISFPCAPFAPRQWLYIPLLCMAALDLGFLRFDVRQTLLLSAVHIALVVIVRQRGLLCERGGVLWEEV